MSESTLFALSLCRKAGALRIGYDASVEAAAKGAFLVVVASDAADRTKKNIFASCGESRCIVLDETAQQIEQALGRRFAVAAVCDENLAQLVKKTFGDKEQAI